VAGSRLPSIAVATGPLRDEAALAEGIRRWVAEEGDFLPGAVPGGPALAVTSVVHASAGMANETLLVELGPDNPGIVLRLPPLEPSFKEYDLAPQAYVQDVVAGAGVPAPAPVIMVTDRKWIGTPFLAMPWVHGIVPGPAPIFDEWITKASPVQQRQVQIEFIDTLAAIHQVEWSIPDLAANLVGPGVTDALEYWAGYVEWAGEGAPLPALVRGLEWCRSHLLDGDASGAGAVLLWGDPRLGNLVFGDDRKVRAVLDWDLAAIGPPEMDLGWVFGLDFMMERLFSQVVPGFMSKVEAVEHYEHQSGHQVVDLDWHEVFALVRALAINDRHERIAAAARGKRPRENPMGEILLARLNMLK
jgi:aminoglycoside phosphotransferase (APT) family kinase protein